ncbi:MAG: hypothetical protein ACE37F_00830 [Nannocystaceae bacterium]|nr:hypothetical protein [bacterium]
MAAKDLSHRELMALPKRELAEETLKLAERIQSITTKTKEKTKAIAEANADYMSAAAGAAAAGWMMGTVQKEIDAGTEGYSEESKKILGVDKDLAFGLGCAGASYVKQLKKYKIYLRGGGIGALGFFIGRKTFEHARAPDEEDVA